jgi:hypothetical protein
MDESTDQSFEFVSSYFGFRVRVSIISPSNALYIHRLAAQGIKQPDDPASVAERYAEQVTRALAGAEFALLNELAEEQNVPLKLKMETNEGSFKKRKIRGRYEPQFIFRRGAARGGSRKTNPITYEKILVSILRYKGNTYGELPKREKIAKRLGCSSTTIKNVLLQRGERRRWREFVKAILDE